MTASLSALAKHLQQVQALHDHICPRQVLGLRMGMLAGHVLGLQLPQHNKRLLALVETDGCFADGVMVATGCSMGHRTMRLMDHGKIAVVFVDTISGDGTGLRIWPQPGIREIAMSLHPEARSRWHAQLQAYQTLPDDRLLFVARVDLLVSVSQMVSRPGIRAVCERCGEEVINERERLVGGRTLCRHCAGEAYFSSPLDFSSRAQSTLFEFHQSRKLGA